MRDTWNIEHSLTKVTIQLVVYARVWLIDRLIKILVPFINLKRLQVLFTLKASDRLMRLNPDLNIAFQRACELGIMELKIS